MTIINVVISTQGYANMKEIQPNKTLSYVCHRFFYMSWHQLTQTTYNVRKLDARQESCGENKSTARQNLKKTLFSTYKKNAFLIICKEGKQETRLYKGVSSRVL